MDRQPLDRQSVAARAIALAYLLAHFLYLTWDGLRVHWADDDPMNMYGYWQKGLLKVVLANFTFFDGSYRPLGGLFYLPLFHFARLNPFPYRLTIFLLLALNTFLVWWLARTLGGSEIVAGFAALFACLHGSMPELAYMTSVVYDILCFTFLLLAMIAYARGWHPLVVLTPFLAALNAKEMAIVFPALLIGYELLYRKGRKRWIIAASLVMAAGSLWGKLHGPNAMASMEAYKPVLSLSAWLNANTIYSSQILYWPQRFTWQIALAIWIAMALYAWWRSSRLLGFALLWALVATIPISFIPIRGSYALYIPLVGWALFAAGLLGGAIESVRFETLRYLLVVAAALTASWINIQSVDDAGTHFRRAQAPTWMAITALDRLELRPAPGQKIFFLDTPFLQGYDMVFIASLWFNDHSLSIADAHYVEGGAKPEEFDSVLRFEGRRLTIVK